MWSEWIEANDKEDIQNVIKSLGIAKKTRKRDTLYKRYNFYAYIKYRYPNLSYQRLGKLCNQDHSTVYNAIKVHNQLIEIGDREYMSVKKQISNMLSTISYNGNKKPSKP